MFDELFWYHEFCWTADEDVSNSTFKKICSMFNVFELIYNLTNFARTIF